MSDNGNNNSKPPSSPPIEVKPIRTTPIYRNHVVIGDSMNERFKRSDRPDRTPPTCGNGKSGNNSGNNS